MHKENLDMESSKGKNKNDVKTDEKEEIHGNSDDKRSDNKDREEKKSNNPEGDEKDGYYEDPDSDEKDGYYEIWGENYHYSYEWHEEDDPNNDSDGGDPNHRRSNNRRGDRDERREEVPGDDRPHFFSRYQINILEKIGLIVWALGHIIFTFPITFKLLEGLNYYNSGPNLLIWVIIADCIVVIGVLCRRPFFQPFLFFTVFMFIDILVKDLGLLFAELYPNYAAVLLLFIPSAAALLFMGLVSGNIFGMWFLNLLNKIIDTYFWKFPLNKEHQIDRFNRSRMEKIIFICAYSNIALSIISQIGQSSEQINSVLVTIMSLTIIANILAVNSKGSYRIFMILLFLFSIVTFMNNSFMNVLYEYHLNIIMLLVVFIDVGFIIVLLVSVVIHSLPYLMRLINGLEERIQIRNESVKAILMFIIIVIITGFFFMLFGQVLVFFFQMAPGW